MKTARPSPLQLVLRILDQELRKGCPDKAVVGGVDRFLAQWLRSLGESSEWHPLLNKLNEARLLPVSYGEMTPAQRKVWIGRFMAEVQSAVSGGVPGQPASPSAPPSPKRLGHRKAETDQETTIEAPVQVIPEVGPSIARSLALAGIGTVGDLLYFFPRRHVPVTTVSRLTPGVEEGVVGTVWGVNVVRLGEKRMGSTEAAVGDETGNIRVLWFNQPFVARSLKKGARILVTGRLELFQGRRQLQATDYSVLEENVPAELKPGFLLPVYPWVRRAEARGGQRVYLPPRLVRRLVRRAIELGLSRLEDFLPLPIREGRSLMALPEAVRDMHYPADPSHREAARHRLAFDELLTVQLVLQRRRLQWREGARAIPIKADYRLLESFLQSLPFTLTKAQRRALADILKDMEGEVPMARLLQGEVGSGKTVVATAAMLVVAATGRQAALMAPTEILAEQHFLSVTRLLMGLARPLQEGYIQAIYLEQYPRPIMLGLLLGSMPKRAKEDLRERAAAGGVDLMVGTHALIQEEVALPRLALAVVDEQQRFGVMQRKGLREKGGQPHVLVMSATPIPRSLALTLYRDLDLSTINELPPGRQPIKTRWVAPYQREAAYRFVREQVSKGHQGFVVCPLIEESEVLQTRAAQEEHRRLSQEVFPDLRVGLLHGRMSLKEKEAVMESFRRGEVDLLVSTPVVEVGIDVPRATVMMVEGADRFGLSQLHQLRGRVGRGSSQGYCMLLADDPSEEAKERLQILEQLSDGFAVAEADLKLRGPGDLLGNRQSGLPMLKVANLQDLPLAEVAREEVLKLLGRDPGLALPEHRLLARLVEAYLKGVVAPVEIS